MRGGDRSRRLKAFLHDRAMADPQKQLASFMERNRLDGILGASVDRTMRIRTDRRRKRFP